MPSSEGIESYERVARRHAVSTKTCEDFCGSLGASRACRIGLHECGENVGGQPGSLDEGAMDERGAIVSEEAECVRRQLRMSADQVSNQGVPMDGELIEDLGAGIGIRGEGIGHGRMRRCRTVRHGRRPVQKG